MGNDHNGFIFEVVTARAILALTGHMDLDGIGLFRAGKSRATAIILVGILIANPQAKILVISKENAAVRSFLQLITNHPRTFARWLLDLLTIINILIIIKIWVLHHPNELKSFQERGH